MIKLTNREKELTRWVIGCALEAMIDNLEEDEDYINLESTYDGLIENWQEMSDEELEDIQEGLASFVIDGSGRFGYEFNEERLTALRAEQMKYITGDK